MRLRAKDRSPAVYSRISLAAACTVLPVLLIFATPSRAGTPVNAELPSLPLVPKRESRAVHKQIETLEMQWRQAQIDNDITVMDHLLADDYVGISANGTIETKSQVIAQRKAGTLKITQLDLDDLKVRLYGDTAVVTSKAELQGVNGQSDISGKYRYTRVYNRRLGQWKIISFEASRIHDADERPGRHQ
ncbi:nuclear transport factor 2 family protein [Acidisarcina polymorpha]|nr:nuclear transport factor 2 family protein [Acidisarcina polymorpha]